MGAVGPAGAPSPYHEVRVCSSVAKVDFTGCRVDKKGKCPVTIPYQFIVVIAAIVHSVATQRDERGSERDTLLLVCRQESECVGASGSCAREGEALALPLLIPEFLPPLSLVGARKLT